MLLVAVATIGAPASACDHRSLTGFSVTGDIAENGGYDAAPSLPVPADPTVGAPDGSSDAPDSSEAGDDRGDGETDGGTD